MPESTILTHEARMRLARYLLGQVSVTDYDSNILTEDRLKVLAQNQNCSLFDYFLVLATTAHTTESLVGGRHLALAILKLVGCEHTLGGPYEEDGAVYLDTNLLIALFLLHYDAVPAQLGSFVSTTTSAQRHHIGESYTQQLKDLYILKSTGIVGTTHTPPDGAQAEQMYRKAAEQLKKLPGEVSEAALKICQDVQKNDTHSEIALLPYFFASSLIDSRVDDEIVTQLCVSNIFLWISYTIYDDIIDGEEASYLLPIANIVMRMALASATAALPKEGNFDVNKYYNEMDGANNWELTNCRTNVVDGWITVAKLPEFKDLYFMAARAKAHCMGPMIILANPGLGDAGSYALLQKGLDHYLIAKQLGDDLHDWKEDLQAGNFTYVVVEILKGINADEGTFKLERLVERATQYFWEEGFMKLVEAQLLHNRLARRYLIMSGVLKKNSAFYNLVTLVDDAAVKSRAEYLDKKAFLAAF